MSARWMPWTGPASLLATIILAIALAIGWISAQQQLNTLSHRLAVTQAAAATAESALMSVESQTIGQTAALQATVTDHSTKLGLLRSTVNHLCDRAAGSPVDVSPLPGLYLVC